MVDSEMTGGSRSESESTSTSLIRRVKMRDQEAWKRLVRLYAPLVNFWVARTKLQSADARDVVQDIFTAVFRGIDRFQKEHPKDNFRGWLRTITRNKIADHYRQQQQEPTGLGGPNSQQKLESFQLLELSVEEENQQVQQLRLRGLELIQAEFELKTWQMFWRVVVDGEPTKDVAAEMSVTPSAVRLAKSRVLRRLREELGDDV